MVTFNTVYQAVGGSAVAQSVSVTTASVFASYSNFTILIGNLWNEYRVESIQLSLDFTFNTATSGLYIPTVYMAQFRGTNAPASTIAGITALPWYKMYSPPKSAKISWYRPRDDPETAIYRDTTAALPILGGIVGYVGAAAPTSTVAYMVVKASFVLKVRGRKV